jgi:hypothetical protein
MMARRRYRLYRYANVAHFLCYHGIKSSLQAVTIDGDLVRLGLLTPAEAQTLLPAANRMRDTVCGWLADELQEGVRTGRLSGAGVNGLIEAPAWLRNKMGEVLDNFDRNPPK